VGVGGERLTDPLPPGVVVGAGRLLGRLIELNPVRRRVTGEGLDHGGGDVVTPVRLGGAALVDEKPGAAAGQVVVAHGSARPVPGQERVDLLVRAVHGDPGAGVAAHRGRHHVAGGGEGGQAEDHRGVAADVLQLGEQGFDLAVGGGFRTLVEDDVDG